ncbi:MAG: inorganic pyrophosphatase [Gemmataceae bacterium]|nr:inorganic pyrophosphatase [Gemmataceae bacterium]
MSDRGSEPLWTLLGLLFRSHPWHGVPIGPEAPEVVTVYIEIVPTDTVKYELDKATGHLKVDRPQRYSNICPTLYGLIPQTFCGDRLAARTAERTGRTGVVGDQDPLDVCVLTEKAITHGDILLQARPIGGFRMLDGAEADDKIIAVLDGDAVYGAWRDIRESPPSLVERLQHYFLTYKDAPGTAARRCEIAEVYDAPEAMEVIGRCHEDYRAHFAGIEHMLTAALRG